MKHRTAALALILLALGCSRIPIESPAIRPIGNAKNWMLTEPLVYRVGSSSDSIVIPEGFVTDFASIPPKLQSLIQPLGPHLLPSIVHDYLYWEQGCTKSEADSLFRKAMVEMRVPKRDVNMMYDAVHFFGSAAWSGNARERAAGLPRVVPKNVRRPKALETWEEYRRFLFQSGIRPAPPAVISREFCARGSGGRVALGL